MRRRVWLVVGLGLAMLISGAVWAWRSPPAGSVSRAASATGGDQAGSSRRPTTNGQPRMIADTAASAPAGVRIRVRVLNASGVRGMAKHLTFVLRTLGYDVVDFDNEQKARLTESRIEMHTAHADWGARLRQAVGTGAVVSVPDSLRYVDFTVRLGSDWRPPSETFRP